MGHHHSGVACTSSRNDNVTAPRLALTKALALTAFFFFLELVGGFFSNSLALIADAGHLFADFFGLFLALCALKFASRKGSNQKTFGYGRVEILGAFINALSLFAMCGGILFYAFLRIQTPEPIQGGLMLGISLVGLLGNLLAAKILHQHSHDNLNIKGAYLHVLADTLSSIASVIGGLVVVGTGWTLIDPLLSILISMIILITTYDLLKTTTHILLQGTPSHLNFDKIKSYLEELPFVASVHDLHIWTLGTKGEAILTVHLELKLSGDVEKNWHHFLFEAQNGLLEHFEVAHATIQMEPNGFYHSHSKVCN